MIRETLQCFLLTFLVCHMTKPQVSSFNVKTYTLNTAITNNLLMTASHCLYPINTTYWVEEKNIFHYEPINTII